MKNNILFAFTVLAIFVSLVIGSNQFQFKLSKPSIPIIIDTDGDTDDFFAILYALKSKELDVRGITYQGGGWSHAASAQNIVDIIDDIYPGRNIPVILGADYALYESDRNPDTFGSPGCTYQKSVPEIGRRNTDLLHGLNRKLRLSRRIWYDAVKGFNITQDLADLIDSTIKQTGKKPIIVATGPVTNIAMLLRAFPTYTTKIEEIVWMGGALYVTGNVFSVPNNTHAEFNVFLDCIAAQELLASDLKITLVPLDFTNKVPLNTALFDKLSNLTSFYGKFTYELLSIIRSTWLGGDPKFFNGYFLWDAKTIAIIKNIGVREIVSNRTLAVTCKGNINYDGQFVTSQVLTNANLQVASEPIISNPVEDSPFFQDFIEVLGKN
ncbi:20005_t:CDS:2 [Entrophospora sp. SA101]|nr:1450_t:CDS:2 [Entrophospora sp. SA101]CAJ0765493.1 20005_t:CDS:2 [Entrophospora sp. SA101]CAJ0886835.1 7973_t:CDS:2 [Entrophospora sp. SA101]CAJ0905342.1 13349_t:CDS:2 [Entrophospora sp. SA101]